MRILVAPQELKGTLTAVQGARALDAALSAAFPDWSIDLLPMADGGPGTVGALLAAGGGEHRHDTVADPLGRPVQAEWGILPDRTAVIEWAAASGLWRLRRDELDPRGATSLGTGELLRIALDAGCRSFILGLGGSGTNDGGAGFLEALGYRLLDAQGRPLPRGGAALVGLAHIETRGAHPALAASRFLGATDVSNPLCGPDGASATYGPQKGAGPATVAELDAALSHFADVVEREIGRDVRNIPGAGSAGGGGAAAAAFLSADLRSGAEVIGAAVDLERRVREADIVLTAEGRLDGQTSFGKGPLHLARLARSAGKPILCIAGTTGPGYERLLPWFDQVEVITREPVELPAPEIAAAQLCEAAVRRLLTMLSR